MSSITVILPLRFSGMLDGNSGRNVIGLYCHVVVGDRLCGCRVGCHVAALLILWNIKSG